MWVPKFLRRRLVLMEAEQALRRAGVPAKARRQIMKGWKTWVGGIGLIATGVGSIAAEVVNDTYDMPTILKGCALIGAGFAAIGLGHKQEVQASKIVEAVKANGGQK